MKMYRCYKLTKCQKKIRHFFPVMDKIELAKEFSFPEHYTKVYIYQLCFGLTTAIIHISVELDYWSRSGSLLSIDLAMSKGQKSYLA